MIDLVCLVADKNMESVMQEVLARPEALGIRAVASEILPHPRRDPGCFHEAPEMLRGYLGRARHALVLLDLAWEGAPESDGDAKPGDPKAAVEWALREARKPRSSSIYRDLAARVSLGRCQDRAFLRLRKLLAQWFPAGPSPG